MQPRDSQSLREFWGVCEFWPVTFTILCSRKVKRRLPTSSLWEVKLSLYRTERKWRCCWGHCTPSVRKQWDTDPPSPTQFLSLCSSGNTISDHKASSQPRRRGCRVACYRLSRRKGVIKLSPGFHLCSRGREVGPEICSLHFQTPIPTFPRVCFVQVAEAYGPWKETGETNSVGEVRKLKEEKTLQMPKQENEDTYVIHEGRDPPRQWYV